MHGYGEYSGYDQMYEFIRHTVRKGSVVDLSALADRHRDSVPGPVRHRAVHEVLAARASAAPWPICGRGRSDGCSRTSGGRATSASRSAAIITANLANRYRTLHLPKPRAIWLEDPHDGGLVGFDEPAVDDSLRGIPSTVKLQCHSSAEGVISEPNKADGELQRDLPEARAHPEAQQGPGAHPARRARHPGAARAARRVRGPARAGPTPTTGTSAGRAGTPCAAAPTRGSDCRYALGNTRQHRSNGRWSDGVPISPLKIQDAAPIRP